MLTHNDAFNRRDDIKALLGGDKQKGICPTDNAILLFTNEDEIYTDYFYPKGTYDYCMYTGIGRKGHQDSIKENNMYALNIDVLTHKITNKPLLMFERRKTNDKNFKYYFIGCYELTETHQNIQPDAEEKLRRVFVFHLEKVSNTYKISK